MKKYFFAMLTVAAALCGCSEKEILTEEPPQTGGAGTNEVAETMVFTATMEGAPETKATYDGTYKCASWEVGDQISINGFQYAANAAGTSTTFSMDGNGLTREIRPVYVNSTTTQWYRNNSPSNLVDDAGTSTRWCASTSDKDNNGAWNIVVYTCRPTQLKTILLWNAESGSGSYQQRIWKEIKVYGSQSSTSGWEEIKAFNNLNLQAGNYNLAGEVVIDASKEYTFYRIDVLNNNGNDYMQMSDMKFVVCNELRPAFVSSTDKGSYQNQPASNLVDDAGTSTRWIADKNQKSDDGVWNIVVSTGSPTLLKTIKLWNAENTADYPNRVWKDIRVYGSASSNGPWTEIQSAAFKNMNLEANNGGFAGEIVVNAVNAYTFYKIDVHNNKDDNYMQMGDMKFTVDPGAPYHAYFPTSLFDGHTATLPSTISETWADGKFNMPMYAHSESTDLQFKNLCGVLKVIVKNSQMARVKHITVSSSNHAMSGAFAVDANNAAILLNPTETSLTKTVNYTTAVETSAEGTVFYVAIPAQTYQDLAIVVSDGTDCKDMVTKSGRDIVVERNKIYPVTFEDNTPYSGFGIAVIDGVEVEVPWVQLWEGGPKWATYNVGAEHSRPQDYGGYYAWGGCTNKGNDYYADGRNLTGEHDTATKLWGDN